MTKKKFGKGMPVGASHQPAKGPAATASPQVQQLGASAPSHAELIVAPRVRLSVVTESLLRLWRNIQGGFVTESLLRLWRSIQGGFVTESLLGLWRSIQGGVGRLIRFFLGRRDAGVVHPSAPPPSNTPGGVNPSAASRSNTPGGVNPSATSRSNAPGGVNPPASRSNAPGGDGRAQCRAVWNEFGALQRALDAEPQPQASPPGSPFQEQPPPQQPQAPPHPFQMVNGELVSDEELAMYADYCRARSTSGKDDICHMCIFVDRKYYLNKFKPSDVLLHCTTIHKTPGLECEDADCMVRVTTQRELRRHKHFCHDIPTDWWQY